MHRMWCRVYFSLYKYNIDYVEDRLVRQGAWAMMSNCGRGNFITGKGDARHVLCVF